MQGLYKKVLKGIYPKIPSQFSPEMGLLLRKLLTVNPNKRPSCSEILEMNVVSKKLNKLFPDEFPDNNNILLSTIRCPKNLMYLTDRLPQSAYNIDESMTGSESKANIKSMHGRINPGEDLKHSLSYIGSKITKATSSSNDSQNILPNIKKLQRNKISSLSKDHSAIISRRKLEVMKKSKTDEQDLHIAQDVTGSRINTINPDNDYENEFENEKDEKPSANRSPVKNNEKLLLLNRNASPSVFQEDENKVTALSKTPTINRKSSPSSRNPELILSKEDKSNNRTPNYINLSSQIEHAE